ncbi:N-acetylmuramoyl-L-alanine amidase [Ruminiclostridium sufflavum DSM 19573]|uniref:N-acetylmuramoyl-L-alanine amidase n=1 Tax=Ruminiclostridium sufflavum DSM 19573 TaxID=1121337 RepID=A0A318XN40_9FIRM|nr:N-acetylmuramoyl-L-alanine amidase [Ruminiclostridium sufflavum]PYG88211.1 N-acetylmuramoyl-L-alanine amidase [Ruminiclostridium sufflavum DSM 19573]
MKRPSERSLRILIALLSIAIILLSVFTFLVKNGFSIKDIFPKAIVSEFSAQPEGPAPAVIIDAGHGGWEPGAINGSIQEKEVTLAIALEVEKILKEKDISYFMIRNDDTYVSLEDRIKIANEKACRLFVSIHNNSYTDPAQRGVLTAYNPYSDTGKDIAGIMQSRLENLGMRNRELMPRPNLYVLRYTSMPSILLEIGFLSNKKDLKLLTDGDFQQKCAQQIVLGIEDIAAKYFPDEVKNSAKD